MATDVNLDPGPEIKPFIVNELLCFVHDKLKVMPPDSIGQVCGNFYNDNCVATAKQLLYDKCASVCNSDDRSDRNIKRQGPNAKRDNMNDILSFMQRKPSLPATFVAQNISNLPAASFNNLDVSTLLSNIENFFSAPKLLT